MTLSRSPLAASPARGFTLVELMVTILVLAVLLMVAVPSFDGVRVSNQLGNYSTALVASSKLARTEAIKRNAPVTLCVSADGTTCSATGGWELGWIVLSGSTVIRQQPPAANGYRLRDTADIRAMHFDATGLGADQANVLICRASPSPGTQERVVKISPTGRVSVARTRTGLCV